MDFLWTTIHVTDIEASLEFYTDIVELKVMRKAEFPDGQVIVFLGQGETQIELIYRPGSEVQPYSQDISIGFRVDSVEAMIEKIQSKGLTVSKGPIEPNPKIKFFYVTDPMGAQVQFVEIKE